MKSLTQNNYSLFHTENFCKKLQDKPIDILNNYFKIIMEYLQYMFENIKIKNINYYRFILIRGIETINNVFSYILFYTQNLELTIYHIQKSFYFYVEFIQQTSSEQNVFLELSSRDATMYVYRKTIFELNNEFRKNYVLNNKETNEKIDVVNKYLETLKAIIYNILCKNEFYESSEINKYLGLYQEIGKKFISINLSLEQLTFVCLFLEKINSNKINLNAFLEILNLLLKKITKNSLFMTNDKNKNKLFQNEFIELVSENPIQNQNPILIPDKIISFITE